MNFSTDSPKRNKNLLLVVLLTFFIVFGAFFILKKGIVLLGEYLFTSTLKPKKITQLSVPAQNPANWCSGADFNHDGKVDGTDYNIWLAHSGESGTQQDGDANGDGLINQADYNIWSANNGKKGCEGCYVRLLILETKTPDGSIGFSLTSTKNLYGHYDGLVKSYGLDFGSDYILRTYDGQNRILNEYPIHSARLDLWDDDSGGGMTENDSATISVTLPYNQKIAKITIKNKGVEINLGVNPSALQCQRTCKLENETGDYETYWCCAGLLSIPRADNSFTCANCGNNDCSQYEDDYICSEDCVPARHWCSGADINKDHIVDVSDLAIFATNYRVTGCAAPDWCQGADINKDHIVDVSDLGILASNYRRSGCYDTKD